MAETVTRMQLAKNGDFKVKREQRTSTGQSGTKRDRRRLPDVAFGSRLPAPFASRVRRTRTIGPTSESGLKGRQLRAEYFLLS